MSSSIVHLGSLDTGTVLHNAQAFAQRNAFERSILIVETEVVIEKGEGRSSTNNEKGCAEERFGQVSAANQQLMSGCCFWRAKRMQVSAVASAVVRPNNNHTAPTPLWETLSEQPYRWKAISR